MPATLNAIVVHNELAGYGAFRRTNPEFQLKMLEYQNAQIELFHPTSMSEEMDKNGVPIPRRVLLRAADVDLYLAKGFRFVPEDLEAAKQQGLAPIVTSGTGAIAPMPPSIRTNEITGEDGTALQRRINQLRQADLIEHDALAPSLLGEEGEEGEPKPGSSKAATEKKADHPREIPEVLSEPEKAVEKEVERLTQSTDLKAKPQRKHS